MTNTELLYQEVLLPNYQSLISRLQFYKQTGNAAKDWIFELQNKKKKFWKQNTKKRNIERQKKVWKQTQKNKILFTKISLHNLKQLSKENDNNSLTYKVSLQEMCSLEQWFSTWGTRTQGVRENVTGGPQNLKKTLKRSPFG